MISQIGVSEPLPMLLDLSDLPAGWVLLDQRRWRTGSSWSAWARAAKEHGGVTAWRSFQLLADARGLWVEALPLANGSDVRAALEEIWPAATLHCDPGLANCATVGA